MSLVGSEAGAIPLHSLHGETSFRSAALSARAEFGRLCCTMSESWSIFGPVASLGNLSKVSRSAPVEFGVSITLVFEGIDVSQKKSREQKIEGEGKEATREQRSWQNTRPLSRK